MTKLFYRLSSRRSFAKLFSLLAFVLLGFLFPQQTLAQFGWEPFPPSFWGGDWDPNLTCEAVDGTTTLNRNPPSGDSVIQSGTVRCTFTDPAKSFQKTAICSLDIQIDNLSEQCVDNGNTSKLTVIGTCPNATIANGNGTIDCTGAPFCGYAGSKPNGNKSDECVWNLGWGALKGQNVVPLTASQCQTAFGSPPVVFSFTQTFEGTGCALSAQTKGVGDAVSNFCHSDTWDPSQAAFCDFQVGVKNTATAEVKSFLTADTEYNPNTINANCKLGKDQGDITLIVHGNNSDEGTNSIDVQAINQATITVNGRDVIAGTCGFSNPDTLSCRVASCADGHSIIENTITGKTATLTMDAFTIDGTHIVGDVETKKVSGL